MSSLKDFLKRIEKITGVSPASRLELVKPYKEFIKKVLALPKEKGIDFEKVHNVQECTLLTDAEWDKLADEFADIHSKNKEELDEFMQDFFPD